MMGIILRLHKLLDGNDLSGVFIPALEHKNGPYEPSPILLIFSYFSISGDTSRQTPHRDADWNEKNCSKIFSL